MKIGHIEIGVNNKPFIIAEMSGNHNQSLERALQLVDIAAEAGAHAIKLQTYTAETMTLNIQENEFVIQNNSSLWKGESLYNLYQKAYTPWEWHAEIFDYAKSKGLLAFSSPFDETAVDFLEELNVPAYKIASFENIDIPLIRKVAETGKPIIVSTGMASVSEINEAVQTIRATGNEQIVLLKCTSTYPASPENSNVATIPHLRALFNVEVGLSDHTMGVGVATAAVALGGTVIEKHFTTSRAEGGVDATFSLEPHELKLLVEETERAWASIGQVSYGPTTAELPSVNRRRSLYISEDIKAGDVLTKENIKSVRPGLGLPTKYYDLVLGKAIKQDAKKGTPLSWELLL